MTGGARMVDVGAKRVTHREAVAEGVLKLRATTVAAIRDGKLAKGDAFEIARVAAIMAAKNTPQILPLCHPLPLTGIQVDLSLERSGVRCRTTVRTDAKTGVEMEALVATATALLTVWDVVKPLEKDDQGQYPETRLESLVVVKKVKA